jgi:hypothetical protein
VSQNPEAKPIVQIESPLDWLNVPVLEVPTDIGEVRDLRVASYRHLVDVGLLELVGRMLNRPDNLLGYEQFLKTTNDPIPGAVRVFCETVVAIGLMVERLAGLPAECAGSIVWHVGLIEKLLADLGAASKLEDADREIEAWAARDVVLTGSATQPADLEKRLNHYGIYLSRNTRKARLARARDQLDE